MADLKIRIYDLAKELKLDANTVIGDARREGVDVSVPSNTVPFEVAERIRIKYFPKKAAPTTTPRSAKLEQIVSWDALEPSNESTSPKVAPDNPTLNRQDMSATCEQQTYSEKPVAELSGSEQPPQPERYLKGGQETKEITSVAPEPSPQIHKQSAGEFSSVEGRPAKPGINLQPDNIKALDPDTHHGDPSVARRKADMDTFQSISGEFFVKGLTKIFLTTREECKDGEEVEVHYYAPSGDTLMVQSISLWHQGYLRIAGIDSESRPYVLVAPVQSAQIKITKVKARQPSTESEEAP